MRRLQVELGALWHRLRRMEKRMADLVTRDQLDAEIAQIKMDVGAVAKTFSDTVTALQAKIAQLETPVDFTAEMSSLQSIDSALTAISAPPAPAAPASGS